MNEVHPKSAVTATKEIVLAAHDRGQGLLWERYEHQLPLCGFTDNGLNCRKCFNGPCRINPFGDEPSQGVCGATRDQIVMENLFQATFEGVLETVRSISLLNETAISEELPDIAEDLLLETRKRLLEKGFFPIRKDQLFEIQNSHFSHKGYLPKTLMDLTRLGLIHYGFLKGASTLCDRFIFEGHSFDAEGINVLIVGQTPLSFTKALQDEALQQSQGKKINLLIKGLNAADQGTPELALFMNLDALIITPDALLPGLEGLAERFDIPVILLDQERPLSQTTSEVVQLAVHHRQRGSYITSFRIKSPSILPRIDDVRKSLTMGKVQGVVVILGETNVKQTFFERTLTLMENCLDRGCLVLVGGELGVQRDFLNEELLKRTGGKFLTAGTESYGLSPLSYFGSFYEIPKLVPFLRDVSNGKEFGCIPVVIAFPEFSRASTWAAAVSFLSLGFAVQIGTPLPFWGSPPLTETLLREWPMISGGNLLVSPSLPSSQEQAVEIISFLEARKLLKDG